MPSKMIPSPKAFYGNRRTITHDVTDRDTDVFGKSWAFSMGTVNPGQVKARKGRELITLPEGRMGLFVPPFSVIEWEIGPGTFFFDSI